MRLEGKIVVITGAGSGVGRAPALELSPRRALVFVVPTSTTGLRRKRSRSFEATGGTAVSLGLDVSQETTSLYDADVGGLAVRKARHRVQQRRHSYPSPGHGLRRSHARGLPAAHRGQPRNRSPRLSSMPFSVSSTGTGGVILNTGSVAGLVGWGGAVYGATKGGVHLFTKAVAIEAAPFGIRVNAICPAGMPDTGFFAAGGMAAAPELLQQVSAQVGSSHPLGRAITAKDCAEAASSYAATKPSTSPACSSRSTEGTSPDDRYPYTSPSIAIADPRALRSPQQHQFGRRRLLQRKTRTPSGRELRSQCRGASGHRPPTDGLRRRRDVPRAAVR